MLPASTDPYWLQIAGTNDKSIVKNEFNLNLCLITLLFDGKSMAHMLESLKIYLNLSLLLSILLIAWYAGMSSSLAASSGPALALVKTNQQTLFHWPTTATNYVLQSNPDLASTNWAFTTDAVPVIYGSEIAMTVSNHVAAARYFRLIQVPATTSDGMALIPAGPFIMGDALDGERDASPTNTVILSPFYMDTNMVRVDQWQTTYAYATSHGYIFANSGYDKGPNYPVGDVDWYDCVKWCNARSQSAGLNPVYFVDAALTQIYTNGDTGTTVYANWADNGYRLPTEAEWEKAARGGLTAQRFPYGNTLSWALANYEGNFFEFSYDQSTIIDWDPAYSDGDNPASKPYTSPVGSFTPNGFGLYDMAGNLYEWCWDWYASTNSMYPANLPGSPYLGGSDPRGPAFSTLSPATRVLRGGAWSNVASSARCAARASDNPAVPANSIIYGFRCVRRI